MHAIALKHKKVESRLSLATLRRIEKVYIPTLEATTTLFSLLNIFDKRSPCLRRQACSAASRRNGLVLNLGI